MVLDTGKTDTRYSYRETDTWVYDGFIYTGKENTDLIVRFTVHIFFLHFWTSSKYLAAFNSLTRNRFRV